MGRLVAEEFSAAGLDFVVIDRDDEGARGLRPAARHPARRRGDRRRGAAAGRRRARPRARHRRRLRRRQPLHHPERAAPQREAVHRRPRGERGRGGEAARGRGRAASSRPTPSEATAWPRRCCARTRWTSSSSRRASGHLELQIEETPVRPGSPLVGQTLKASPVRSELGIMVVAIKKPDGKMAFNPSPEAVLEAGDLLIALGRPAAARPAGGNGGGAAGGSGAARRDRSHRRAEDQHEARDVGPEHERDRERERPVEGLPVACGRGSRRRRTSTAPRAPPPTAPPRDAVPTSIGTSVREPVDDHEDGPA